MSSLSMESKKYTDINDVIDECLIPCADCTGAYIWPRFNLRLPCQCSCGHKNQDRKKVEAPARQSQAQQPGTPATVITNG